MASSTHRDCNLPGMTPLQGHHPARSACPRSLGVTVQRCASDRTVTPRPVAAPGPMARPTEGLVPSLRGSLPAVPPPKPMRRTPEGEGHIGTTVAALLEGDPTGHATPLPAAQIPMHARLAPCTENVTIFLPRRSLAPRPSGVLPPASGRPWLPPRAAPGATGAGPAGPRRGSRRGGTVGRRRPKSAGPARTQRSRTLPRGGRKAS